MPDRFPLRRRPVATVSLDTRNRHERADTVLVVPLTTSIHPTVPTHVLLTSGETLAVEEGLQIRISGEEANGIQTVGDLYYLFRAKHQGNQDDIWEGLCAAISSAGVLRENFKPETPLSDLGIA